MKCNERGSARPVAMEGFVRVCEGGQVEKVLEFTKTSTTDAACFEKVTPKQRFLIVIIGRCFISTNFLLFCLFMVSYSL